MPRPKDTVDMTRTGHEDATREREGARVFTSG